MVERTVLNPPFFGRFLRESGISEHLHETMLDQYLQQVPGELPQPVRAELDAILKRVFSAEWLSLQVERSAEEILGTFKGDRHGLPTLEVDLGDRKELLREELLASLKRFAPQQLTPPGLPPGVLEAAVEEMIRSWDIPDRLSLQDSLIPDTGAYLRAASRFQFWRGLFRWLPYALLGFGFLLCLLLAGVPGGLKWAGAGLLVSGLTVFAGLALVQFSSFGLPFLWGFIPGGSGDALADVGIEALKSLISLIFQLSCPVSLICAGIGLGLLLLGLLLGAIFPRRAAPHA